MQVLPLPVVQTSLAPKFTLAPASAAYKVIPYTHEVSWAVEGATTVCTRYNKGTLVIQPSNTLEMSNLSSGTVSTAEVYAINGYGSSKAIVYTFPAPVCSAIVNYPGDIYHYCRITVPTYINRVYIYFSGTFNGTFHYFEKTYYTNQIAGTFLWTIMTIGKRGYFTYSRINWKDVSVSFTSYFNDTVCDVTTLTVADTASTARLSFKEFIESYSFSPS